MAVQKSKKSRSRRDIRRAEDTLKLSAVSVDKTSGETHLRHHITKDGFYKGRQVLKFKDRNNHQSRPVIK